MPLQCLARRRESLRHQQFFPFNCEQRAIEVGVRDPMPQAIRKDNAEILVKRQETAIEGAVDQRAQTEAVSGVGAAIDRGAPRDDVARDQ